MKKKLCVILVILISVLTILGIALRKILPRIAVKRNVTYVGHSDGPTAIFLAGKISKGPKIS